MHTVNNNKKRKLRRVRPLKTVFIRVFQPGVLIELLQLLTTPIRGITSDILRTVTNLAVLIIHVIKT